MLLGLELMISCVVGDELQRVAHFLEPFSLVLGNRCYFHFILAMLPVFQQLLFALHLIDKLKQSFH